MDGNDDDALVLAFLRCWRLTDLISLMSLKQLALTPYYMKLPAEWDVDGYTIADQLVFKPEQWPTKLSFFFKLKLAIYEELGIL